MKTLQEVTQWDTDYTMPNHVYFVSDNREKCYGYVRVGDKKPQRFKTPYSFSTARRKFQEVPNIYRFSVEEKNSVPEGFVKYVVGSKGDRYTITEVDGTRQCSCSGFKFRGKCRHTEL